MQLIEAHDPILREVAPYYTGEPRELELLARQLYRLMQGDTGRSVAVGIAAPQAGQSVRMFLINTRQSKWWQDVTVCINPALIECRGPLDSAMEGCLSAPGERWQVARQCDITCEYTNLTGERVRRDFTGINARMFLHELDHLNGVTLWSEGVLP